MSSSSHSFGLTIDEYRSLPIPGLDGVKRGFAFAKIREIVDEEKVQLHKWLRVNPRKVKRNAAGKPTGHVIKEILDTLENSHALFPMKNNGLFIIARHVDFDRKRSKSLRVTMTSASKHGIANGGHTFAALKHFVDTADPEDVKLQESIDATYVPINLFAGVSPEVVRDIAEGLNTAMSVDDASLMNMTNEFEPIKTALKGHPKVVSYMQNDDGVYKVSEIVRFVMALYPGFPVTGLYRHPKCALKRYKDARKDKDVMMSSLISQLPRIIRLYEEICYAAYEYGKRWSRRSSKDPAPHLKKTRRRGEQFVSRTKQYLPFMSEERGEEIVIPSTMHAAWAMTMLEAFQVNVVFDSENKATTLVDWDDLLTESVPEVMNLVDRFVTVEHNKPEDLARKNTYIDHLRDRVRDMLQVKFGVPRSAFPV